MSDNFENNVDKFDSGEYINMESDRDQIQKISEVAEIMGEEVLRNQLGDISRGYHGRKRKMIYGITGIAATLLLVSYFTFLSPKGSEEGIIQPLMIDEQPILLDSASYDDKDSIQINVIKDSIN